MRDETLKSIAPLSCNMEPGTGTTYATFANDPSDDDFPNSMRINGTLWKCGHDYIDTELADVCELVEIIGKSSWCDTRDAEDQPPLLVFRYERYNGINGSEITVDPNTPDREFEERFIERWTGETPPSAESPW